MNQERLKILLVEDDEDDYILTLDYLDEIRDVQIELDWVATFGEPTTRPCD